MTALEIRCGELMTNLGRLDSVTKDKGIQIQIGALDQKAAILVANSAELKIQLATMVKGGLCAGVKWGGLAQKLDSLDHRIGKVIEKLDASPEKINDGQAWPQCERLAHEVAKDLKDALKSAWNGFVTRKTLNRVSVFSVLKDLTKYRGVINELEGLDRVAKSRLDTLPQKPEDITFIIDVDTQMTDLINGLGIADEPPEMIDFLKRCASANGVPLSELTDERLKWLRSKDFEQSLRVRG